MKRRAPRFGAAGWLLAARAQQPSVAIGFAARRANPRASSPPAPACANRDSSKGRISSHFGGPKATTSACPRSRSSSWDYALRYCLPPEAAVGPRREGGDFDHSDRFSAASDPVRLGPWRASADRAATSPEQHADHTLGRERRRAAQGVAAQGFRDRAPGEPIQSERRARIEGNARRRGCAGVQLGPPPVRWTKSMRSSPR